MIFVHQDDEPEDYYESRHSAAARRRFEDDLEVEAQAERRIINAKKVSSNLVMPIVPPFFSLAMFHANCIFLATDVIASVFWLSLYRYFPCD